MEACSSESQVQSLSPHFPWVIPISPNIVFAPGSQTGGVSPLEKMPDFEENSGEGPQEHWDPLVLLNRPGPSGLGKRRGRLPLKYASLEKQIRLGCSCSTKCMTLGCPCKGTNQKCTAVCHLRQKSTSGLIIIIFVPEGEGSSD